MVLAARTGPTGEAAAAADSAQGSRREGKCPASTLLPQRLRQGLPQAELMQKTEGEGGWGPRAPVTPDRAGRGLSALLSTDASALSVVWGGSDPPLPASPGSLTAGFQRAQGSQQAQLVGGRGRWAVRGEVGLPLPALPCCAAAPGRAVCLQVTGEAGGCPLWL